MNLVLCFFKQNTAYEMRISDWSSDVCSSDLFAEAAVASPDSKRQELYDKVQKILIDDVPVAWQLELQFPTITHCKVKDLVTTAIGVNDGFRDARSEEHTSELQSLMRISYAVFCL